MKRFEEGLYFRQIISHGFGFGSPHLYTPEEENFLSSEENIYEYMYLYDYSIMYALFFNLLKDYLRNIVSEIFTTFEKSYSLN